MDGVMEGGCGWGHGRGMWIGEWKGDVDGDMEGGCGWGHGRGHGRGMWMEAWKGDVDGGTWKGDVDGGMEGDMEGGVEKIFLKKYYNDLLVVKQLCFVFFGIFFHV